MKLNPFETYCLYLAISNHFKSGSYDYFKYGGKVSAKVDKFMERKDRFYYVKLASRYTDEELKDFFIANILAGKTWIGDILKGDKEYLEYVRVKESITYCFQTEINALFDSVTTPQEAFATDGEQYPPVVLALMSGKLSLQVFVILDEFVQFFPKLNSKLKDDAYWQKISTKANKLRPFLQYDKSKIKVALTNSLNNRE